MGNNPEGLILGYILDGAGDGKKAGWAEINNWQPDQGTLWVHMDYSKAPVREWLDKKSDLDSVITEALSEEDSRPRCTLFQEGLLLSLRGVNMNPGSDPEDMVGIRIWLEKNRVISTSRRSLLSVSDVGELLDKGIGPETTSEFMVLISGRLMERMEHVIDDLEDSVADLEDRVLTGESMQLRSSLAALRRQAISLRRYLSPQREALSRLLIEKISWLDETDRIRLREISDQLIRFLEDLDEARDRAAVTQEELVNRLSEQMNNKMYLLSIVAAIFLPLGFLTGLLGVNVGGIPGADSKLGFAGFVLILIVVVVAQIWFFKKKKWL